MLRYFTEYKLEQILRKLNENADALARLVSAIDSELGWPILIELLNEPSTNIIEQVLAI